MQHIFIFKQIRKVILYGKHNQLQHKHTFSEVGNDSLLDSAECDTEGTPEHVRFTKYYCKQQNWFGNTNTEIESIVLLKE